METKILDQLARIVLPSEILERFEIVKIETDEQDIDAMSMTIHLDERMNERYLANVVYESLGFMEAVSVTDFPIRDHKVILKLRRRRWRNKETGESSYYTTPHYVELMKGLGAKTLSHKEKPRAVLLK